MGWSVGGKGYRYTKTANGRKRTTISIPGTGISWVKESKGKSSAPSKTLTPVESPVSYQHWPKKYQWHLTYNDTQISPVACSEECATGYLCILGWFGICIWEYRITPLKIWYSLLYQNNILDRLCEARHRQAMTVAFPLPTGETAILQRLLSGL